MKKVLKLKLKVSVLLSYGNLEIVKRKESDMSLKDYLLNQENHLENMEKKLHFTKGHGFLTAADVPFDRHILMAEELYKDQPRLTKEIMLKNRTILVNLYAKNDSFILNISESPKYEGYKAINYWTSFEEYEDVINYIHTIYSTGQLPKEVLDEI